MYKYIYTYIYVKRKYYQSQQYQSKILNTVDMIIYVRKIQWTFEYFEI